MEAVVVDAGSKLLKAGFAIPDQAPSMVTSTYCLPFYFTFGLGQKRKEKKITRILRFYSVCYKICT